MASGVLKVSGQQAQPKVGLPLHVFKQNSNHVQSMQLLADNGLRPLTYQEALVYLMQYPEDKEKLKRKWFWLDGKGITEIGLFSFNEKGELIELTGKETLEQKVRVWPGDRRCASTSTRTTSPPTMAGASSLMATIRTTLLRWLWGS